MATAKSKAPPLFEVVDGQIPRPAFRLLECQACSCRPEARQPLPGRGNTKAMLAIVGQNPHEGEDRSRRAFAGEAWAELLTWLGALGLSEAEVYVTYAVKCRTKDGRQPQAKEMGTCRDLWLVREMALLPNLKAVITLGKMAKTAFLGGKKDQASVSVMEASRATVTDPLGRSLVVLPLPNPMYYQRAKDEKPYLVRVVLPEVRAVLAELGVVRAD